MDLHVLEENSAPLKKGAEVQRERVQHAGFISKKRPVQCASCPLPRTILAVTVGSALAVADALMQGHTRNPLADPGLLGISAGAALAVVIGFTWCGFTSVTATGVMALIGALIAAAIVFVAANVVGARSDPLTLILAGAALSAVFVSITTAIIYTSTINLDHMRMWTVGSAAGRDGSFVFSIAIALAIFTLLALLTAPRTSTP